MNTMELQTDIVLNKDAGVISPLEDDIETDNHLCIYDVLADHYVKVPENGKPILDLIVQLWSQSFASHIFSLLFHKWLFEVEIEHTEVRLCSSSALVEGASNVFWIDIQTNKRRFFSLFYHLPEDVALVPKRLSKILVQAQRDLYLLLSRFIFFYNLVCRCRLETFLNHYQVFPNAFLVGGRADFFVIELTDQVSRYPRHLISMFFSIS
ncbi:uncharacterized protein LOC113323149 [Papaver somniferum]|uniref:uncharacterized protein LOC113323149 n=1 Tax=Papaver somniferum TaxID=3469 RepID=UPI000E6FF19B|nr:uncharacterized protein LOC113323149 [Papaver somniferum]XP_026427200.1 uncharacterized protein LOC113323149 [Papaver somniferum]XP_026427201.1 uncharacterized protein LOC113323149 [Papaver somniferum]